MTSSLVGSEMCIRDSHSTALEQPQGTPCLSKMKDTKSWCEPHAQKKGCLLYTSDAADDMSV
eukprot:4955669-Prorocentrum_lima.AAC.1